MLPPIQDVFRYKIDEKTGTVDEASVQKIVTGLWDKHEHEAKAFTLDNAGTCMLISAHLPIVARCRTG